MKWQVSGAFWVQSESLGYRRVDEVNLWPVLINLPS